MMNNAFNLIDSASGLLDRTGVVGSNYPSGFQKAVDYFQARNGGRKSQYDLSYEGSRDEFVHTPIFNEMLYISTTSNDFNTHLIESIANKTRHVELCLKPKYLQLDYPGSVGEVIIMPGSNLMQEIDPTVLKVLAKRGAKCKLHPITCRLDISLCKERIEIIEGHFSGVDVVSKSTRVHAADSSELGLIAKYLGKEVTRLYLRRPGTYCALYDNIDQMDTWLNSAKSGVIRMDHYKEDIDEYLEHYWRHHDDNVSLY
ncbi:hypothetical protein [Salinivibrio sp. KP-1]|uniref:hypothetical protein n=1 Tax=Salinivibrio sp. KP-1 TaxID=1406902 RepID=UPI0006148BFF|nr:hypothetical protein [Salinivibrio sp. KP-1]KKA43431.1 hypothetical protein WN56_13670 [Salinivibrio sp. KP-1]